MLKKISKKAWIQISVCFAMFVAIAVITAFFDLQISKGMYNANSFFGQFFAVMGEFPSYLAVPAAAVIAFHKEFGKTKKQGSCRCGEGVKIKRKRRISAKDYAALAGVFLWKKRQAQTKNPPPDVRERA